MANKVLLKKSSVAAKVPLTTDLDYGELALNYTDGKLYFKNASNTIKSFTIDDSVVTLTGTQTLTNKTLTSPTINGNITGDGAFTGYLKSLNSSGDEGGEILLAKPQTNTTLVGTGITIDAYQNRIRFFEQGGTARGAFIDITTTGGGVSSEIITNNATQTLTNKTLTSPTLSGTVVINGLIYPNSDGTNGQVITTNGAGTLSWGTVSGGGVVAGGYNDSSLTAFPSGDYNGTDTYVGQSGAASDAFGVSLLPTFTCMDPVGSLQTTDLGVL